METELKNKTGNELIAEFLGLEKDKNNKYSNTGGLYYKYELEELRYDKSWDWLMPVIDKIESLGYNVKIHTNYTSIHKVRGNCTVDISGNDKLETAYFAVVGFIKNYNL